MMGESKLSAYYIIIFGSMAITLLFAAVGVLGVRERVKPVSDEKYKFREIFGIITQRPVFITMLLIDRKSVV